MTTKTNFNVAGKLSDSQRVARGLLGVALLGTTMLAPVSPLGWFAVGALIAIVPLATAVLGACPAYGLFGARPTVNAEAELSVAAQLELGLIGALLVGSVYAIPFEQLGAFAVFALMGIFPLVVALMGVDPIVAARTESMRPAHETYEALNAEARESAEIRALQREREAVSDQARRASGDDRTRAA